MFGLRTLCVLSFIGSITGNSNDGIEGIPCTLKNGSNGSCQYLANCESAKNNILQGEFPKICDFDGLKPIICCPEKANDSLDKFQPPVLRELKESTCGEFLKPDSINLLINAGNSGRKSRKPGEISALKCKEYAHYAKERVYSQALKPNRKRGPNYIEILECAIDNNPLISGGKEAKIKEFPHMAAIGFQIPDTEEIQWLCGGTLISENFVLTAAHCFKSNLVVPKYVRLGITNASDTFHEQKIRISKGIHIHPYYVKDKYHDIALIKLETNVKMNPFVRPACLNTKPEIPSVTVACGFGAEVKDGPLSNSLMKVTLEISDVDNCQNAYKTLPGLSCGIIDDLMLCAGAGINKTKIRDTCGGDSGGPLQIIHDNRDGLQCMYDIVGVTSFGKACGINSFKNPGVYTRVSSYISWIEDIVWPEH